MNRVVNIPIYILFLLFFSISMCGQIDKKNIPIRNIADSMRIVDSVYRADLPDSYKTLKKHSQKKGFGKQLYRLLIKEPRIQLNTEVKSSHVYDQYEGKIIRDIHVLVESPFRSNEKITSFFNNAHAKTNRSTILSLIQFKQYSRVNPALFVSSIAELRDSRFLRDVNLIVDTIANVSDSVDVTIKVRDKWTIGLHLSNLSSSRVVFSVYDANILGTGNMVNLGFRYSNKYKKETASREFGYSFNYLFRNIAKQNILAEISYNDKIESIDGVAKISRPIQPRYRNFGEVQFSGRKLRGELVSWDSISPNKSYELSFAFGRTFNYKSRNYINQFVLTGRFKTQYSAYDYAPYAAYMENKARSQYYSNYKLFLLQASFYRNSYKLEHMIYNVGTGEDIAIGYNISAQLGYAQMSNIGDAMYASFSGAAGASSAQAGTIYFKGEVGSFLNKKDLFGGVFKLESIYMTPIKEFFGVFFRQFVSVKYAQLFQTKKYFDDYIYMGQYTTLKVRNWNESPKGQHSVLIQNESNVFAPFELAGFRFAFYGFLDFGWIGQNFKLIASRNFNYGYGFGVRLHNNFIVFNTISIKIGIYPKMRQDNFSHYYRVSSSDPRTYPNFVPQLPSEVRPYR